jgi:dihydroorotate dehydrogenase
MLMLYGSGTLHISQIYTHFRPRPRIYSLTPFRCYIGTPSLQSRSYTPRLLVEKPSLAKNILLSVTIASGAGLGYLYLTDTHASVHRWLAVPLVRAIWPDAEDAHQAGVNVLKELHRFGLHPRERGHDAKDLEIDVFGHTLVNPLGISSGLDKNGEIPTPLLALGPAVVEIGGVTETRQSGNPRPRLFRIVSQQGMLNRYGLNSDGAELVAARLRQRLREFAYHQGYRLGEDAERFVLNGDAGVPPGSLVKGKLMAIQVAKNASTPDGDIEAIRRD